MHYHAAMIETLSFAFGLGFSILVYILSIRQGNYSPLQKAAYFLISTIGITGMVWLCGVLIAHFLKNWAG
jgi:uncharacterized membrane protein (DUF106 family)